MDKNQVSVRNLVMDGRKASALVVVTNVIDETHEYEVNTNRDGEGLWIDGKQVTGTCQFGVTSAASARAAFRRWFE